MSDLLRYILESGVCLALFYVIYWVLLKDETYFLLNRFYLVSALALSFLIPGFKITSPLLNARAVSSSASLRQVQAVPIRSLGLGDILLVVYIAGVLVFLMRFVVHLIKLRSVVRRYGLQVRGGIKIVSIDREFAPFSFLNVVFLNERDLNPDDLERILAHERVHIQQGHSLDVLLMELVIVLQWFNPFVWPYKKSLQETHEYLADNGVIAQGFSAVMYKRLVFEQHVGAQLFEFANNFKQSQIKRRLTMMSKIKSRNAAKLKLLFVLPLASLLVLAFAEPKPAGSLDHPMVPVLQEKAGQGQEVQVSKEKVAQAKDEYKKLKEKEMKLREKLEATEDVEAKKELEHSLQIVLLKQQELKGFLAEAGTPPNPGEVDLKAEYKSLQKTKQKIRDALAQTDDPEKKAGLKKKLEMVLAKQAEIKVVMVNVQIQMAEGDHPANPTLEELKKEYLALDAKAKDIRAKLEKTTDANEKAELEDLLKKISQKQEQIKAQAQEMKAAQEAKKK
ncbi:MAG: M56 family metallopeptidase [Candidatus Aminicenantales bacterium]